MSFLTFRVAIPAFQDASEIIDKHGYCSVVSITVVVIRGYREDYIDSLLPAPCCCLPSDISSLIEVWFHVDNTFRDQVDLSRTYAVSIAEKADQIFR